MDGQRSPMGSTTLGGPRNQACSRSRPKPAFQGFERRSGRGRVHISSTFATTSPPASRINSATTPASSSWNRPASTVSFDAGWPGTPSGAMSTSGAPPRRTCGNRSRRADAARLSVNLAAKTRMSELAPQATTSDGKCRGETLSGRLPCTDHGLQTRAYRHRQ